MLHSGYKGHLRDPMLHSGYKGHLRDQCYIVDIKGPYEL